MTQPKRRPTISCLYEMCAAGGSCVKSYRLRLPFDPYEMIWRCRESPISDDLPFSALDDAFMGYPGFTVPDLVVRGDPLDRYQSVVGEHLLAFGNAGQFGDLALLPEVSVDPMFFYRNAEHRTGTLTVDIPALLKDLQAPLLIGQPCDHPGLDG